MMLLSSIDLQRTSFFKKLFLERERKREALMWDRNNHQLPPSRLPLGIEPTTRASALTGSWTDDLSVHKMATPKEHLAQAPPPRVNDLEETRGTIIHEADTNKKDWSQQALFGGSFSAA